MYLKNYEIRHKNLEICQIHHKRKIYKSALSISYAFFILSESIVDYLEDLDFSKLFWYIPSEFIHFSNTAMYHSFLLATLAHNSDRHVLNIFICSKDYAKYCETLHNRN